MEAEGGRTRPGPPQPLRKGSWRRRGPGSGNVRARPGRGEPAGSLREPAGACGGGGRARGRQGLCRPGGISGPSWALGLRVGQPRGRRGRGRPPEGRARGRQRRGRPRGSRGPRGRREGRRARGRQGPWRPGGGPERPRPEVFRMSGKDCVVEVWTWGC